MSTAASVTTDLTTCPICLEMYANSKSLPCLHAFCLKCLRGHFKDKCLGDKVPCPVCSKEFEMTFTPADVTQVKRLNLIGELTVRTDQQPGQGVESDGQQLKEPSDAAAVRQDELIQATDRERQLQMQLDKMNDDVRHLKKWFEYRPNLQKEFEDFKLHTSPQLEQEMKQREMGRVIQSLPEGEPVFGVTSLDNLLYVLRGKSSEQIEVYDIDTYQLLRCLTVVGLGAVHDIVACKHNRCAYISCWSHGSVHRVALPGGGTVTHWPVNDEPAGLSLTDRHGVLVSCPAVGKIKEFSADGQLLHVLTVPQDVVTPMLSIQLSSGQFIVCHGDLNEPLLNRVCLVGSDGSVIKSFGGSSGGSGSQQMNVPLHVAVDRNEFVYVVDVNNYRVLLLSPLLTYVCDVVTREQLKWGPVTVYLDSDRGRLYVADNECKVGDMTTGRVVVSV